MDRDKVREWRLRQRLTQKDLAYMLGVSMVSYSRWETGATAEMHYGSMALLRSLVEGEVQ